ncbi:ParB N-terminal domain-containing protein [candidate division KSB1 bacterium]
MKIPKPIEIEISEIRILKGRRKFDKDEIYSLAESIKTNGQISPIVSR